MVSSPVAGVADRWPGSGSSVIRALPTIQTVHNGRRRFMVLSALFSLHVGLNLLVILVQTAF